MLGDATGGEPVAVDNIDRYPHSPQGYPHRCNYKSVSRPGPALFRQPTRDPGLRRPPPVDNSTSPVDKSQECVSAGRPDRPPNTRNSVSAGHRGALDVDKSPFLRASPGGHAVYTRTGTGVIHSSAELSTRQATAGSTRRQPLRTARIPGCPQLPHLLLLRLSIYMKSFKRKRVWGQLSPIVRTGKPSSRQRKQGQEEEWTGLAGVHHCGLLWGHTTGP